LRFRSFWQIISATTNFILALKAEYTLKGVFMKSIIALAIVGSFSVAALATEHSKTTTTTTTPTTTTTTTDHATEATDHAAAAAAHGKKAVKKAAGKAKDEAKKATGM
jgi:hypothetical protein